MSNIMVELKAEINRLAAKAARAHTMVLKKTSARHRREIAALKREVAALRKNQALLVKQVPKTVTPAAPADAGKLRFRADGFKKLRKRLGLAAVDLGKLIEVSGLTIYNWESGKAKPRKMHLPKIAAIREMGKREVQILLEKVGAKKGKK